MRQRALQAIFLAFLPLVILIVHLPPAGGAAPPSGGPFRPARPADRKAAIAIVQAQLQAFKKDDFQKATQYQSSGLKQRYGSSANFGDAIQHGYPAFIHFKAVTFGAAQTPDGGRHLFLPVTLIETGGVRVRAIYLMLRQAGVYKVDGVQGGEAPPPGADGAPSQQT